MSNSYAYWNGQPVNTPVYPQMGNFMQTNSLGGGAAGAGAIAGAAVGVGSGAGAAGAGVGAAGAGIAAGPAFNGGSQWTGQAAGSGAASAPSPGAQHIAMAMPNPQMGMGDFGQGNMASMGSNVSSPLNCNLPPNFFSQSQGAFEPCIDNGEAFCAYNGMDMSMNYGQSAGTMPGGKGGFW
ncbi:hypothetical protein KR009_004087 [Drosophila setifemur]|nr:hypothetical protein KR009_004087 [Drosophila setifemur]